MLLNPSFLLSQIINGLAFRHDLGRCDALTELRDWLICFRPSLEVSQSLYGTSLHYTQSVNLFPKIWDMPSAIISSARPTRESASPRARVTAASLGKPLLLLLDYKIGLWTRLQWWEGINPNRSCLRLALVGRLRLSSDSQHVPYLTELSSAGRPYRLSPTTLDGKNTPQPWTGKLHTSSRSSARAKDTAPS